jgi:hypothetical protein
MLAVFLKCIVWMNKNVHQLSATITTLKVIISRLMVI